MNNLLSHYDLIFSYQEYITNKKFNSSYPAFLAELDNNLSVISNLFGASIYYESVQTDLEHIYKRDQVLDNFLFNFFFSIEEILK